MPRRRYYRRRRPRRRRRFRRRRYRNSTRAIAIRALKRTRTEMKYETGFVSGGTVDFNGTTTEFANTIAQGDGFSQRIGNEIYVSRLTIKGHVQRANIGVEDFSVVNNVLFMLVLFKGYQDDFDITDLLNSTGDIRAPYSFRALGEASKYRVLWSRLYMLTAERPQRRIFLSKRIGRKFRYDTGSQVPNDWVLALVRISDVDSADEQLPTVTFNTRTYYVDK